MIELVGLEDRIRLLRLARCALEARVRGEPPPVPDGGGALNLLCGAFVSLHRQGSLRGCLGSLAADTPLGPTIARLSAAVADSDPRFSAVLAHELARIDLEISVLTRARRAPSAAALQVGRHGVIVDDGVRRGLLLPQVAEAHGWDRETFLDQACLKAGLRPGAWRSGIGILLFEAQVFGEGAGALTESTAGTIRKP